LTGIGFWLPRIIQCITGSVNCLIIYALAKKAYPAASRPAVIAGMLPATAPRCSRAGC
jgi:hypothetical protein